MNASRSDHSLQRAGVMHAEGSAEITSTTLHEHKDHIPAYTSIPIVFSLQLRGYSQMRDLGIG